MANKITDLYMISRMETQFKGNLAGAKLPQNIFPLLFVPVLSHQNEECVQLLASHSSSQRGPGKPALTQAASASSIPTDALLK